jgi:hypothetical protein
VRTDGAAADGVGPLLQEIDRAVPDELRHELSGLVVD